MKTLRMFFLSACLLLSNAIVAADAPSGPSKFEKEIAAFEATDAKTPPSASEVLFIGSSSIRKWTSLATDFPEVKTVNRGFGGSEISDSIYYFDRIMAGHHPRLVVFYAGTNDLNNKKTPEAVAADFRTFCGKLHAARPEAKVIFISIGLAPSRWARREAMAFTNAMIAAYCAADPRRRFVDFNPVMLTPEGEPRPELYQPDRLHLNADGYLIWAKALAPYLK